MLIIFEELGIILICWWHNELYLGHFFDLLSAICTIILYFENQQPMYIGTWFNSPSVRTPPQPFIYLIIWNDKLFFSLPFNELAAKPPRVKDLVIVTLNKTRWSLPTIENIKDIRNSSRIPKKWPIDDVIAFEMIFWRSYMIHISKVDVPLINAIDAEFSRHVEDLRIIIIIIIVSVIYHTLPWAHNEFVQPFENWYR